MVMIRVSLSSPTAVVHGVRFIRHKNTPQRSPPLHRASVVNTPPASTTPLVDRKENDPTDDGFEPKRRFPMSQEELPFTLADIRKAIPKHCFERSLWKSLGYFARDALAIGLFVYGSTFIDALPVSMVIKYGILWPFYWFGVSAFGVGVWILSHECGHGSFSEHEKLNDFVGWIGHSFLLIPYFSWKHSHRRHHAYTGSVTYDEAYVPFAYNRVQESRVDVLRSHPILKFTTIVLSLVFGFPLYLIMNLGGREANKFESHFNPWSTIFNDKERWEVVLSNIGMILVLSGLFFLGQHVGFLTVAKTYIIPYFIVHVWLVLITLLHHTHPDCPHYDDKEWTFLKGALSTIDRDFGFLNIIFHRITDTHVVHHLFSQIPFYHALEATEAIKPVIGSYYKSDKRPIWKALWEDFENASYVAPDKEGEGVLWYRS